MNERQIVAKMSMWNDPTITLYGPEGAPTGKSEGVSLNAVYAETGVNKEWAKSTPSGQLNLTIDNPGAQGFFQKGKEYLVTIREAQPGE